MLVEAFITQAAVEGLDVGILVGLARSLRRNCTPLSYAYHVPCPVTTLGASAGLVPGSGASVPELRAVDNVEVT